MASFNLRDLPPATWAEFEARADAEGRPLRPLLFALVKYYVDHGLPPEAEPYSPIMSRARSDGKVGFLVTCPNGHLPGMEFDRAELLERVRTKTLKFWCLQCDAKWPATANEYANIERRLEDGTL
jgi:hypothetical protein